ncbi:MAG: PepSY-like domain-containing protein [Bacteroidia bacterium]
MLIKLNRVNLFVFSILIILSLVSNKPKDIELPEAVKKTFLKLFPNAKEVKWEGDANSYYEIGFINQGADNTARILPDGSVKEIETTVKVSEVPLRIVKALQKKFPKSQITFAVKISRPDNSTVYDLEINTGLELLDITMSTLGYEVY